MWYVCIKYGNKVKITFCFCSSSWRIFYYVTITLFIFALYLRFLKTLELPDILVRSNYAWEGSDNYVLFSFVIVTYFLLRYNYVVYLFHVVKFSDDVRNRLYFGKFVLCMEITLQLRFAFVCHCNINIIKLL